MKYKIIDLNEIAFTELIVLFDIKERNGKIAFNIFKGWKNKNYPHRNADNALEKFKSKYEPISHPFNGQMKQAIQRLTSQEGHHPEV